ARTAADRAQLPPGAGDRPAPARRRASAASPSSPPAPRPRPPALALAPARRPGAGPARGLLDVPTELEIDPQVSDRNVVVNVVPLDLGGDAIVEPVLGEGARALPGHGLGEAELKLVGEELRLQLHRGLHQPVGVVVERGDVEAQVPDHRVAWKEFLHLS